MLITSSFCSGGDCVGVEHGPEYVAVRDSKRPDLPALFFTPAEWTAFIAGAKAGEFDRPTS